MSLALKVRIVKIDQVKTMRFTPTMSVSEACNMLKTKSGVGGQDHGLFQPGAGRRPSRWLRPDRTLQFYDLKSDDLLMYKKKHRPLKVLLVDGAQRTVMIDDADVVGDIVATIGRKMGLKNPEEFSLQSVPEHQWLQPQKSLSEQGVTDERKAVLLKKKWFVTDDEVTEDDPVQLHLVYAQARHSIVAGEHPLKDEEACQFAALQCQVVFGNYNANMHGAGFLSSTARADEFFPPALRKKAKDHERTATREYRKLSGMSETKAKYRYVQLIRSLRTYGMTCFDGVAKGRAAGKKPSALRVGITQSHIIMIEPASGTQNGSTAGKVIKEVPLEHLRRWAAAAKSFTLDFGDFADAHLTLLTDDGEAMAGLIAGYIDILLKKRQDVGQVVEEDDAAVGHIENVGRVKGKAVKGQTASAVGGFSAQGANAGRAGGAQRGMLVTKNTFTPGQMKFEDLGGAHRAVRAMGEESIKAGCPQTSSMSVVQWQGQMLQHSDGVGKQSGRLVSLVESGASPDDDPMAHGALLGASAKELAMKTGQMLSAAHAMAGAMGGDEHILNQARAVAAAVAELLRAADEAERAPRDPDKRQALADAQRNLDDQRSALNAACKGFVTTDADQELLLASAKAVAAATQRLLQAANRAERNGPASAKEQRAAVLRDAKKATEHANQLVQAMQTLGPVALDPTCRQQLLRAAHKVDDDQRQLLHAAKGVGIDGADMQGLMRAAQAVGDAVQQLLRAADAAEKRPADNVQQFADAAKKLLAANATLQASAGQPKEILKNTKELAQASGKAVVAAKVMAKNAPDDATRQRLMEAAKRVADATRKLVDACKHASQKPNDANAKARMLAASRVLDDATNKLVGNATRQAALQNMRGQAKVAAAKTTALVATCRSGVAATGDKDLDVNLLKASAKANATVDQLLTAAAAVALAALTRDVRALCPVGSLPAMAPFFGDLSVGFPQFRESTTTTQTTTSHYCVCANDNQLYPNNGSGSCALKNGTNTRQNVCARGETVTDFGCWCWDSGNCWTLNDAKRGQFPGCLGNCGCPPDSVTGPPGVGGCVCKRSGEIRSHLGCKPYACPRGKVLNYWPRARPAAVGSHPATDGRECVCNDLFERPSLGINCNGHDGGGNAVGTTAADWNNADHCPTFAGTTCNCDCPFCWMRESFNGGCFCADGFALTAGPILNSGDSRPWGLCQGQAGTQPHSCTNGGYANIHDRCSCTADGYKGEYFCVASFSTCNWGTKIKLPHCREMGNQPRKCPRGTTLNPYMGCQACYGFGDCPATCPPNSNNGTLPAHKNLCWCEHGPEAMRGNPKPAQLNAGNCEGAPPTPQPTPRPTPSPTPPTPAPTPDDTPPVITRPDPRTPTTTPPPAAPVPPTTTVSLAPTTTTTAPPTTQYTGSPTQTRTTRNTLHPTAAPTEIEVKGAFEVGEPGFLGAVGGGGAFALLCICLCALGICFVVRGRRRRRERAAMLAGGTGSVSMGNAAYGGGADSNMWGGGVDYSGYASGGRTATQTGGTAPFAGQPQQTYDPAQYGQQQQQQYDQQQYGQQAYGGYNTAASLGSSTGYDTSAQLARPGASDMGVATQTW